MRLSDFSYRAAGRSPRTTQVSETSVIGRARRATLNAVKDFFTRVNVWVYVVAEVVRLRAMPETTEFSRIRLPK